MSLISNLWRAYTRALALRPEPEAVAPPITLALAGLHLAAMLGVGYLARWPLWLSGLVWGLAALPLIWLRGRWPQRRAPVTFAPLLLLYGVALLRLGYRYLLRQPIPVWLNYENALFFNLLWLALILLVAYNHLAWAWRLGVLGTLGLFFQRLAASLPGGVTGSDPFAYTQMALDLAQRGTAQHYFALLPLATQLGLDPLPTLHVGYLALDASGWASTVWPPGFSVLLAGIYQLGGEPAMFWLNGLLGLLTALALVALNRMLTSPSSTSTGSVGVVASTGAAGTVARAERRRRAEPVEAHLAGLGAVFILFTSLEHFHRSLMPMADAASALFSTLAFLSVYWGVRHPEKIWLGGALGGLSLALAFSIRYTQLLIAPGLVLFGLYSLQSAPQRWRFLLAFGLAAFIGVLPDTVYRTQLYTSPFAFGTRELGDLGGGALPEALGRLAAEWLTPVEWGWLWPLALVGVWALLRQQPVVAGGLLLTQLPAVGFHLLYPFVRARDLAATSVLLAFFAAWGAAQLLHWLWQRNSAVRILTLLSICVVGGLRLHTLWAIPPGLQTFGHLYAEQRAGLATLATLTEPNAVIACSLNSGAVERYAHRATVRPGRVLQPRQSWEPAEWQRFVAALHAQGQPVYLLMDSVEMNDPAAALSATYTLHPVATLNLPYYFLGGGSENRWVQLYKVEPP